MSNIIKIKEIEVKSIITPSKLPSADFVINPYIGCLHSCIYCYADFMRRFTGHGDEKWGEFVDVKINAVSVLGNLNKIKGKTVLFGSVTDPYHSIESKYQITRNLLKALVNEKTKIEILTKNGLLARDIDILQKFEDITVGFSLAILDESTSKKLEPFASSPKIRIKTLKEAKEAGLKTFVFLSPLFPYISEIEEIIESTKDYVDYFMFENLNIRANNRVQIFNFIKENFPDLLEKYQEIYDKGNEIYWEELEEKIKVLCKKHSKEYRIYFHHGKNI
ncbi:radical SAM protein [archaeon]|jgi:DNA repair photolyase|nr:radical SAM protein [archaeon]MBT3731170.1 radical SAM protein [archaeon]MBT4670076.1 radical SAM protein [archaeon]MBT5287976.1 radical SAM protein [archaeon]MBT7052563.1 radical SAM protein [archaeon]